MDINGRQMRIVHLNGQTVGDGPTVFGGSGHVGVDVVADRKGPGCQITRSQSMRVPRSDEDRKTRQRAENTATPGAIRSQGRRSQTKVHKSINVCEKDPGCDVDWKIKVCPGDI